MTDGVTSALPADEPVERPLIDPVTGQPAAIVYLGVHKSFGKFHILRGLNLIVPRGRITVVIGRSGTGKSVTIKHVMGLMRPDKGHIWVGEDDLTRMNDRDLRKVRLRFGVVFQHAALFDSMNVFENIAFPLREHERMTEKEIRERVFHLLALTGLHNAETKMPSELSGGMAKRVGLARALVRKPEYLLYDEPTTGLDPILTGAMDKLISDTQEAHPTLTSLIISHDMHAVMSIADKIVMLFEGQVVHEGTPDYFRDSSDPLIRQFMSGSLDGPMKV